MNLHTFWILLCALCASVVQYSAFAQNLEVEEFTLENGMKFLLVPREGEPQVSAGWIAKIGSVNERPGVTGIAHLFEHMMFKGTPTIGAKDHAAEQKLMSELDSIRAEINKEQHALVERQRRGEITDALDPAARGDKHKKLIEQFQGIDRANTTYR